MIDGRVIRGVDASSPQFRKTLARLKGGARQAEVFAALRSLLFMQLDAPPAKLHLHQLKGRTVPSATEPGKQVAVWTMHVTLDDRYKASFTLEDAVVYLRLCDEHDLIDKHP